MRNHVLDNRDLKVVDYLRAHLVDAEQFSIVSAYFSIYGYDLLADMLARVGDTRFLFGDPSSVDDLDPGQKDAKAFRLTEKGLVPSQTLLQKPLALKCAEWVKSDAVAIRSVRQSNFLHGKMYLTAGSGVVGSSNFTKNGLGGSDRPNLEINLAISDEAQLAELRQWFDDLWINENLTYNAKQQVLDALDRLGRNYSPEFIYFKTLYELFKNKLVAQDDSDQRLKDNHLYESAIWNTLYEFQKDGVKSVIARMQEYNGCILADSVGLGKTYTALAVIKYYELRNDRVLVICPSKLRENWALYPAYNNHLSNPFLSDRFGYTLLAHTDLSRDGGMSGQIDLANFNWGAFDLIVIDESHNFRNSGGSRYERLLNDIIMDGARTKVLMLSATPVNTSLIDLRNQVYLMTEKSESLFRDSLGVRNVGSVMAVAQRVFRAWEDEQRNKSRNGGFDKAQLLERLGPDFFRLLDGVSISRSRRQIKQFYAAEMERIGQFPRHAKPHNAYPATDLHGELSYERLASQIGNFALSIYRPSEYLVDAARQLQLEEERKERNFNQLNREYFLVAMMRTNFLKRLESSPHSLTLTLQRTIDKIDILLDKIARYEREEQDQGGLWDVLPDDEKEDDDFSINRARRPYHLRELDLPRWKKDMLQDRDTLSAALADVRAVTPERDGKLRELKKAVRNRAAAPTINLDGKTTCKMLVFTTFKDTAEYLYDNLTQLAHEVGLRTAMVSGDGTRSTSGRHDFNTILTNFAPTARGRRADSADDEIDLLIATDCISEGQNLQDCDTVLNYDIHWNPVRLIQRFGRIDRIGSRNPEIRMLNYWPTQDMDAYLKLESRVHARMALVDTAASGSDDPFNEEEVREGAQLELNFRDEQLLKLRDEIIDLDDLADNIVMSDFTMDYFLAQLRQYLEKNKEELEATPNGAYAVAPNPQGGLGTGALFLLRQRNVSNASRQRLASPVHPFYLVYIRDDGRIRYGCGNTRQALDAFEMAAASHSEPLVKLCDQFDHETKGGAQMDHHNDLLEKVIGHIRQSHSSAAATSLTRGGARDAVLPKASESPRDANDFELITWLIVK